MPELVLKHLNINFIDEKGNLSILNITIDHKNKQNTFTSETFHCGHKYDDDEEESKELLFLLKSLLSNFGEEETEKH